jgi:hypothetical protein
MWPLSFFTGGFFVRNNRNNNVVVSFHDGIIWMVYQHGPEMVPFLAANKIGPNAWGGGWSLLHPLHQRIDWFHSLLPRFRDFSDPPGMDWSFGVYIPLWLLSFVLALPWILVAMIRRAYRQPAGMCVRCGYDLRATPDRCPECGTSVSIEKKATQAKHVIA